MSYKDFASNTFWGRFVDNITFLVGIGITIWLFHPEDVGFSWKGLLIWLGLVVITAAIPAALGFSLTKLANKKKKQPPKE